MGGTGEKVNLPLVICRLGFARKQLCSLLVISN